MADAFFIPDGDGRFTATEHTGGPWDPQLQHGGPPAALLTRCLDALPGLEGTIARISVDIIGPVPVGPVEVAARVERPGRSVELLVAELFAGGRVAVRASAWRIRAAALTLPAGAGEPLVPAPPFPLADSALTATWPGGFLQAMQWRVVAGDWSELGPATIWGRMRLPLVANEPTSSLSRVMVLADCGNGASATLPHGGWLFINPDLTVHFARPPSGEWFCLSAATAVDARGFGLARSEIFATDGLVARGAQSLYVAPR